MNKKSNNIGMKKNKKTYNRGVIITRKNPQLNFGQTVKVIAFNEFSDELTVQPDGDRMKYNIHYTECWDCDRMFDSEALNKQLAINGVWNRNTASTS